MLQQKLSPKRMAFILAGSMLSLLLASLDNTIVGTAMPKIIRDLKGMEHYSWPFTAYLLFSSAIIPIAGKLADIYGRKIIHLVGLFVFIIASALCGLSHDMIQLIIFRGLQGLGGGILISNAFIIVAEIFPPKERGKYTGIVASMFGVSSVLGPTVGGFITDAWSWHWIFFVNLPLGLLAFLVILAALPGTKKENNERKIDLIGVAAFILAVFPLLIGFSWAGKDYAWLSPQIIGLFSFSLIMFIVFLILERRSKEPLLPLAFFKNSVFSTSVFASFMANAAMFGAIMFIPLFAQSVLGSSATGSGIITTPMMLSMVIGSNLSGTISSKFNKYRMLTLIGFAMAGLGMLLLFTMGVHAGSLELIVNAVLLGAGIGLTIPIYNIAPQNVFPMRQLGTVTSAVQFFRNMGGTISSAVLGSVMLSSMNKNLQNIQMEGMPPFMQGLLRNPRVLTDPSAIKNIQSQLPQAYSGHFQNMIFSAKAALAGAIQNVFFVCIFIIAVGFIIALFMNEKMVREGAAKHHQGEHPGNEKRPPIPDF